MVLRSGVCPRCNGSLEQADAIFCDRCASLIIAVPQPATEASSSAAQTATNPTSPRFSVQRMIFEEIRQANRLANPATEEAGSSSFPRGFRVRHEDLDPSDIIPPPQPYSDRLQDYLRRQVRYLDSLDDYLRMSIPRTEAVLRLQSDRRTYGGDFEDIEDNERVRYEEEEKEKKAKSGLRGGGGDDFEAEESFVISEQYERRHDRLEYVKKYMNAGYTREDAEALCLEDEEIHFHPDPREEVKLKGESHEAAESSATTRLRRGGSGGCDDDDDDSFEHQRRGVRYHVHSDASKGHAGHTRTNTRSNLCNEMRYKSDDDTDAETATTDTTIRSRGAGSASADRKSKRYDPYPTDSRERAARRTAHAVLQPDITGNIDVTQETGNITNLALCGTKPHIRGGGGDNFEAKESPVTGEQRKRYNIAENHLKIYWRDGVTEEEALAECYKDRDLFGLCSQDIVNEKERESHKAGRDDDDDGEDSIVVAVQRRGSVTSAAGSAETSQSGSAAKYNHRGVTYRIHSDTSRDHSGHARTKARTSLFDEMKYDSDVSADAGNAAVHSRGVGGSSLGRSTERFEPYHRDNREDRAARRAKNTEPLPDVTGDTAGNTRKPLVRRTKPLIRGGGGDEDDEVEDLAVTAQRRHNLESLTARSARSAKYKEREGLYRMWLGIYFQHGQTRKEAVAKLYQIRDHFDSDFELIAAKERLREMNRISGLRGGGDDDDDNDEDDEVGISATTYQRRQLARLAARPVKSDQYVDREGTYLMLLGVYIQQGQTRDQAVARLRSEKEKFGSDFEIIAAKEQLRKMDRVSGLRRSGTSKTSLSQSNVAQDTDEPRRLRRRGGQPYLRGGAGNGGDLESQMTGLHLSSDPAEGTHRSRRHLSARYQARRKLYREALAQILNRLFTRKDAKEHLRTENVCGSDTESIAASEEVDYQRQLIPTIVVHGPDS